jgi:hypothetical protein
MTSDEYLSALRELGLNPRTAAPVLGVSARASQYWARGDWRVPEPVAKLLAYIVRERQANSDK